VLLYLLNSVLANTIKNLFPLIFIRLMIVTLFRCYGYVNRENKCRLVELEVSLYGHGKAEISL
jgi:hypothetical protein